MRPDDLTRWRQLTVRVLGGVALGVCVVTAATAVLLPPPARADSRRPLAHDAVRAGSAAPRDGPLVPAAFRMPGPPSPRVELPRLDASSGASPCAVAPLTGKLDLNSATQAELERLPGIGPAKAQRILAWRAGHGRFRAVRDLRRVKGFGRKTVLRLAPHVSVDGPTTLSGGPAR